MRKLCFLFIIFAALSTNPHNASANDSAAAFGIGGLVLEKNDAIFMESEDLRISEKEIRVKYVYRNITDKPVTLTIAFPIPEVDFSINSGQFYDIRYSVLENPDFGAISFKTLVDGKEVKSEAIETAHFNGSDVTERLRKLNIDISNDCDKDCDHIESLPKTILDQLAKEGLIARIPIKTPSSTERDSFIQPQWVYKITLVRQQTFPPNTPVTVEHRYKPLAGFAHFSDDKEIIPLKDTYCIDSDIQRRIEKAENDSYLSGLFATRSDVSYILKTAANWAKPIGDFRLVVAKEKPEDMVSFCMDGVKKISPTEFEVRKKNFTPTEDLNVLYIKFWDKQ